MPSIAVHQIAERWRAPRPDADNSIGARAVFSARQRWLLLAAFALLVAFRLPQAWVHGRFLDEEATVFLAYAWHRPWLDALFRPFAGYLNLGATATTVATVSLVKHGVVSLERAPYLTMTAALAVQMVPAGLILTGRAAWLERRKAVVAALLMIPIMPATEEVFLNVLHIQFHLALAVALILAFDRPTRRFATIGYAVLLFLAPLCGPGAIVFLPLFAARALVDRDRGRLAQLAAFAAGAAVQLLLFYGASPMRGHLFGPATIAATMFVRLLVLPLFDVTYAIPTGTAVCRSWALGGHGWWWGAAVAVLAFGGLILLAARRRDSAIWLVLAVLSSAATSFGFGMIIIDPCSLFNVGDGERYDFLPLVLLGLALIVLARRPAGHGRLVYATLCLLMLYSGAFRYTKPLADLAQGPSWTAEVAAWRRDHRHPLAVWPGRWKADLSDEARACSPIGPDVKRSTDPRYCESGWVAEFYRW